MNKILSAVKWALIATGFITVYALVDIFYQVNLLTPLWWILEHKFASHVLCVFIAGLLVYKIDTWLTKK